MLNTTQTTPHHVYVIELDKEVLHFQDFISANPKYKQGMPCLFVGETRHTPRKRFNYHLVGYKSHEYIRRYAKRLAPEYYANLNPVSGSQAKEVENHLAKKLRSLGYAVWQHADILKYQRAHKRVSYRYHDNMQYRIG
jgi:hypothetical protein